MKKKKSRNRKTGSTGQKSNSLKRLRGSRKKTLYLSVLFPSRFTGGGSASNSSTLHAEEIISELNCPCGNCQDLLADCPCTHPEGAKEVKAFVQSQIEKELSKETIIKKVVNQYGSKVLIEGTAGIPPYYENIDSLIKLPETLPPESFKGNVTRAYQIAREIPEVLLQLPCYCWCDRIGHGSLLDCFVDRHGVDCIICQEEAFRAEEMFKNSEPIVAIREKIISEFD
jgi:hypothetical protein